MTSELNIVLCEQCQHIYTADFVPEVGIDYVCSPCMSTWVEHCQDSQEVTFQSMEDYEN